MYHALVKRLRDKAADLRMRAGDMDNACARQTMTDAARGHEHMAQGYEQLDEQRVEIAKQ